MPMVNDAPNLLRLEPVLDFRAAGLLRDAFLDRHGEAIKVDASQVAQLGGLCLQVMIAARRTWQTECLDFQILDRSDAFNQAVELFAAGSELGLGAVREP